MLLRHTITTVNKVRIVVPSRNLGSVPVLNFKYLVDPSGQLNRYPMRVCGVVRVHEGLNQHRFVKVITVTINTFKVILNQFAISLESILEGCVVALTTSFVGSVVLVKHGRGRVVDLHVQHPEGTVQGQVVVDVVEDGNGSGRG